MPKIMLKTVDGHIYKGDLVQESQDVILVTKVDTVGSGDEMKSLKTNYGYTGNVSFLKANLIWFYME
ncbi:hypothetical protein [Ammoniphilus sp. 3BR4]|uniref:hypothetical protein n=1 Tax=Ammoniphilus sp. 3BR4 TaxID=3158265 RepID=UPI003467B4B8